MTAPAAGAGDDERAALGGRFAPTFRRALAELAEFAAARAY